MFSRSILVILAATTLALTSDDPFDGTWKRNLDKSKTSTGRPPNPEIITYKAVSGGYEARITGVAPFTIQLDGKPRKTGSAGRGFASVVGADQTSTRSIGSRVMESTFMRHGKVVATILREVSADGRTMTAVVQGVDVDGQKFRHVYVYERQ